MFHCTHVPLDMSTQWYKSLALHSPPPSPLVTLGYPCSIHAICTNKVSMYIPLFSKLKVHSLVKCTYNVYICVAD